MDTTDAPQTSRRRLADVGLVALGASAWLAGLATVGFISSRTDPMIGESDRTHRRGRRNGRMGRLWVGPSVHRVLP